MSKVSIVIPVYNVEQYLRRCIDSVLSQSYTDYEMILVDDGSTDTSGQICDEYSGDSRIHVIHKANEGAGAARNTGIETATGDYITFIDSDDYIAGCYLERMVQTAEQTGSDIVQCGYLYGDEAAYSFRKESEQVIKPVIMDSHEVFRTRDAKIIICAKLYKTILFEGIRYPKVSIHDDEFVTYKLLYKAKRTALTAIPYYYYYKSPNSIMREKKVFYPDNFIQAYEERIRFFEAEGEQELVLISYKERCVRLMLFLAQCYGSRENQNDKKMMIAMFRQDYKHIKNFKISVKERVMLSAFNMFPVIMAKVISRLRNHM